MSKTDMESSDGFKTLGFGQIKGFLLSFGILVVELSLLQNVLQTGKIMQVKAPTSKIGCVSEIRETTHLLSPSLLDMLGKRRNISKSLDSGLSRM
jgi:hypothetical protein